jgi:predicted extracellular nuclease
MKKALLLAIAVVSTGFMMAQTVVFSSNFETWENDTLCSDFDGSRSSVYPVSTTQGVLKVNTGGVYGPTVAQLKNTTASHKRLTTNPVAVVEATTYQIKFWARGNGDLRSGIFDNDLGNQDFGFKYAPYAVINSTSWTEYTQEIVADTTTAIAEFILSFRNTTGNHLEIDSIVITSGGVTPGPTATAIAMVQASTGDVSNMLDQIVTVGGRVTAIAMPAPNYDTKKGFYIQDGLGLRSGIYVFDNGTNNVAIGDSVVLTGKVAEFAPSPSVEKTTQITNVTAFENKGAFTPYAPITLTTLAVNNENYESMLVRVSNATTTEVVGGNFSANDGSGAVKIDKFLYLFDFPQMNKVYTSITGVVSHSFQEFKIYPRFTADLVESGTSSIDENNTNNVSIYPNEVETVLVVENAKGMSVTVVSIEGKVMTQEVINSEVFEINVATYTAGVYFLQVNGTAIKFIKK